MVLRDLLTRRPSLKVVLMSATLDAALFHDYFGGAPSVKFPGRTFPVVELHLEVRLATHDFLSTGIHVTITLSHVIPSTPSSSLATA